LLLDQRGTIGTQSTSGLVDIPADAPDADPPRAMCTHCETREAHEDDDQYDGLCLRCYRGTALCDDCDARAWTDDLTRDGNGARYCSACMEDRRVCVECDDVHHYDDVHESSSGDSYCDDCWCETQQECEVCEDSFNTRQFSSRETRDRMSTHLEELCEECADTHGHCSQCGQYLRTDDEDVWTDEVGCVVCEVHTWALLWRRLDLQGVNVALDATCDTLQALLDDCTALDNAAAALDALVAALDAGDDKGVQ
jgi:hypothetical protein